MVIYHFGPGIEPTPTERAKEQRGSREDIERGRNPEKATLTSLPTSGLYGFYRRFVSI